MGYNKKFSVQKYTNFNRFYFIYVLNHFFNMELQINDSFKYHRLKVLARPLGAELSIRTTLESWQQSH